HTTAGKRTYVRFAVFIQGQIPSNDAPHPISENAAECFAPFCPIQQVVWMSNIRSPFGPIHFGVRMGCKYFLHVVRLAEISMPRNRPGVFAYFLIIEFTNGPAPEVIVMINQPYLRFQSCFFNCRAQMLFHIL